MRSFVKVPYHKVVNKAINRALSWLIIRHFLDMKVPKCLFECIINCRLKRHLPNKCSHIFIVWQFIVVKDKYKRFSKLSNWVYWAINLVNLGIVLMDSMCEKKELFLLVTSWETRLLVHRIRYLLVDTCHCLNYKKNWISYQFLCNGI